jgi:hypothetical protein
MSDDPLMTGFVRLKSLLMEAQEEFGREFGQGLVAAAMRFSKEHGGTTAEAYYGLRDEARRMNAEVVSEAETIIEVGEPQETDPE